MGIRRHQAETEPQNRKASELRSQFASGSESGTAVEKGWEQLPKFRVNLCFNNRTSAEATSREAGISETSGDGGHTIDPSLRPASHSGDSGHRRWCIGKSHLRSVGTREH